MLTGARSRCRSIAADSPNGQFGARSERARETPLDMARGEVGRPPVTRRLGAAWSPQSHITGNMWVLEPSRASKEEVSLYQAQAGPPPVRRRRGHPGTRRLVLDDWQAPTSGGGVPPAAGPFGGPSQKLGVGTRLWLWRSIPTDSSNSSPTLWTAFQRNWAGSWRTSPCSQRIGQVRNSWLAAKAACSASTRAWT